MDSGTVIELFYCCDPIVFHCFKNVTSLYTGVLPRETIIIPPSEK